MAERAFTIAERRLVHARRPSELFVLTGEDRAELLSRARTLARFAEASPATPLAAIAEALHRDTEPGATVRLAVVARDAASLERSLDRVCARLEDPRCRRIGLRDEAWYTEEPLATGGGVAAIFPGEGSQYADALSDLCLCFDAVRRIFDLGRRAFGELAEEPLWSMRASIGAVVTADLAMHALAERLGLRPDAIVGHSAGEFAALVAAGAVEVRDDADLVARMTDGIAVAGAVEREGLVDSMALTALGNVDRDRVAQALDANGGHVHVAMDNCPHQVVVCGPEDELAAVTSALGRNAIRQPLPFDRPYHTPLFAGVAQALGPFYAGLPLRAPKVPLWSCATAAPFPPDRDAVRALAREQWMRPVRFRETVEAMYADGIRLFVELGPGGRLTSFVRDTLGRRPHVAVATDRQGSGVAQLHAALGQLVAHGVDLALGELYGGRFIEPLPEGAIWRAPALAARRRTPPPLPLTLPRMVAPAAVAVTRRAPDPPPAANGTSRAMAAYSRTMERFLGVQRATFERALADRARGNGAGPARPAADFEAPVATHAFDVAGDRWLRDHTLGPTISQDPDLSALPVLPLAVAVELLAAAAAEHVPGSVPVAFEEVRASNWVAASEGRIELTSHARRTHPGVVEAELRLRDGTVAVRGIVRLGPRPAPPEALEPTPAGRPWPWPQETLYAQHRHRNMFHGPAFQGVASMDRLTPDSAEATLRTRLPLPEALTPERSRTAPGVVDALGQVVGFWAAAALEEGFVVFPTGLGALRVHRPPADFPATVRCRARVLEIRPAQIVADLQLLDADGSILMSAERWTVSRHRLPPDFYAFCLDPANARLGHAWPEPLAGVPASGELRCARVTVNAELLTAHGGIWEAVLAHVALGGRERARWLELPPGQRRRDWLLGRIAAKDAVRALRPADTAAATFPADVEIAADENGGPTASLPDGDGRVPVRLSISHAAGTAVALAAEPDAADGVGIDIEAAARDTDRLERAAFDPQERTMLERGSADDRWSLRAWCAKEAVGKALRRGVVPGPDRLRLRGVDVDTGLVVIEPAGSLLEAEPALRGARLQARTAREGELIVAIAVRKEQS